MKRSSYTSIFAWGIAALVCLFILAVPAHAASLAEQTGFRMGPGDHYDEKGNIVSLNGDILVTADGEIKVHTETPADTAEPYIAVQQDTPVLSGVPGEIPEAKHYTPTAPNYQVETVDGREIYTFEGKKYVLTSSWGQHKLSGYNPTADGYAQTYSGKTARARHTVATASELPIGTVVLLKAVSGPYPAEFDSMYVVEDRGGHYIENEKWVDIFFDTLQEANHVTDAGWNYAEVWIAEELN